MAGYRRPVPKSISISTANGPSDAEGNSPRLTSSRVLKRKPGTREQLAEFSLCPLAPPPGVVASISRSMKYTSVSIPDFARSGRSRSTTTTAPPGGVARRHAARMALARGSSQSWMMYFSRRPHRLALTQRSSPPGSGIARRHQPQSKSLARGPRCAEDQTIPPGAVGSRAGCPPGVVRTIRQRRQRSETWRSRRLGRSLTPRSPTWPPSRRRGSSRTLDLLPRSQTRTSRALAAWPARRFERSREGLPSNANGHHPSERHQRSQ
jgi:hypothetical protein